MKERVIKPAAVRSVAVIAVLVLSHRMKLAQLSCILILFAAVFRPCFVQDSRGALDICSALLYVPGLADVKLVFGTAPPAAGFSGVLEGKVCFCCSAAGLKHYTFLSAYSRRCAANTSILLAHAPSTGFQTAFDIGSRLGRACRHFGESGHCFRHRHG